MGTPISGKDGTVKVGGSAKALITGWDMTIETVTDRFGSNESSGYKTTLAGQKSATANVNGQFNSAATRDFIEGSTYALELFTDATHKYSFSAICKSWRITTDIKEGMTVGFTAVFESSGAVTDPTFA